MDIPKDLIGLSTGLTKIEPGCVYCLVWEAPHRDDLDAYITAVRNWFRSCTGAELIMVLV